MTTDRMVVKIDTNDDRTAGVTSAVVGKTPLAVVEAQLDAYNAKDVEALLATYAEDAEQYTLHGALLAKGHTQMRSRFLSRFEEPNLHARLLSRAVLGNVVVDAELITRDFPEGSGTLEMLCIYEVEAGRIRRASFVVGQKTLHARPATA